MDFTKLAAALRKREYEVSCFETSAEAANYLDAQIDGVTVGCKRSRKRSPPCSTIMATA